MTDIKLILEAILMSASAPLTLTDLQAAFQDMHWGKKDWEEAITALQADYATRAYTLACTPSGYFIQTRPAFAPFIHRMLSEKPQRYSRALLETLAIIAYRQPVTRADIESIRGVAVNSSIIKTLLDRDWITVSGHRDVPGKPALFTTTRAFLTHFNLPDLDALANREVSL